MHEIKCPHCGKAFKIDEAGYADIVKQVRDHEFNEQLHERLELAAQDKQNAVALAEARLAAEWQERAAAQAAEIQSLRTELEGGEMAQKLAVSEALAAVEKERDTLANALETARRAQQAAAELAEAKRLGDLQQAAAARDAEIQALKAKLEGAETERKLAAPLRACRRASATCMKPVAPLPGVTQRGGWSSAKSRILATPMPFVKWRNMGWSFGLSPTKTQAALSASMSMPNRSFRQVRDVVSLS